MYLTLVPSIVGLVGCVYGHFGAGVNKTAPAYDYVIIGGGTAGLVVAARLSEDPRATVAVIEAGNFHVNEPLVDVPGFFGRAIGNPVFDWNFVTVPQPALDNAILSQPRGKMLGGSSGLNFMAWDRASAAEYDAWEKLGATGWNWKNLLPYLKKIETVSPPPEPEGIFPGAVQVAHSAFQAFHGASGPLQPSYNVIYSNITEPYAKTLNNLGIPTNSDPYTGNGTGLYNSELSIDRAQDVGRRSYAANTYYNISKHRPNLHVFTSTQATEIRFLNISSPHPHEKASGVNVVAVNVSGYTGTISALKGVILCAGRVPVIRWAGNDLITPLAGALQTPQLLELSGIGNETIIAAAGIQPFINLPGVGENLQDHSLVGQDFELVDGSSTFDEIRNNATFLAEQQTEYATNHTGIFAAMNSALTFAPLTSYASRQVAEKIRREASRLTSSSTLGSLRKAQYDIQSEWLLADDIAHVEFIMAPTGGLTALPPTPNKTYVTINTAVLHPFGRGTVHINCSDPLAPPLINPQYMGNQVDLVSLLEGLKFARKITETDPLNSFVSSPHEPSAHVTSDADLHKYIKRSLGTVFHPAGTAAMVPRILGGVVDPNTLRVYGTSNVYVVDASLVPLHLGTHLQATVYAMAERASDIIKECSFGH
ncbi:alcohol oxidase [Earliella scabrosa]|nr:alcohol oxidase [Earliella scabrosa]